MPSHDTLLMAESLALGYGRRTILHQVNLEIRRGEFWFCLGPNGEGKSTLMRAILGSLQPGATQSDVWTLHLSCCCAQCRHPWLYAGQSL
jgi:ABC-type Mn2+/Zn2+ transport system ATPase subunit